jgi:hypothetical protein
MVIIETPIFTKRLMDVMTDEEYRLLQMHLLNKPDAGKVTQGSGGLRKFRWSAKGHGKSGGPESYITGLWRRIRFYCFFRMPRTNGPI